jgi:hypothetical protein
VSTAPSSNRFNITLTTPLCGVYRVIPSDVRIWEETLSRGAASQEIDFQALRGDRLTLRETDEFLLVREMHHRLANTLSVLTSVLRRELSVSASPELMDTLARYEARIVAFVNLHRSLVPGAASDWISVPQYIEDLCRRLLHRLRRSIRRERPQGISTRWHCRSARRHVALPLGKIGRVRHAGDRHRSVRPGIQRDSR